MAKGSLLVLVALAVLLAAQLKPTVAVVEVDGGYNKTMEDKVRQIVKDKIYDAPGLIRLVFHDCWVKGCDASVLLNITQGKNEIHAVQNGGLRGMDIVQAVKDALAPYGASCADAVVFAAREATAVLSNYTVTYPVDGPGRKDSSTSFAEDAAALPPPFANFTDLVANFAAKKFTPAELVILSGAHVIGRSRRSSFEGRLDKAVSDRGEINKDYQEAIDARTSTRPAATLLDGVLLAGAGRKGTPIPAATVENNVRDMEDVRTKAKYDATGVSLSPKGVLDNSYYTANLQNMVLFNSDWVLRTDAASALAMQLYKEKPQVWYSLFGQAMAKLSKLAPNATRTDFVTGARKYCHQL